MRAETCPNCGNPVNGRECKKCGIKPEKVDTVRCEDCGGEEVKEEAKRFTTQKSISAQNVTKYLCRDCQD